MLYFQKHAYDSKDDRGTEACQRGRLGRELIEDMPNEERCACTVGAVRTTEKVRFFIKVQQQGQQPRHR